MRLAIAVILVSGAMGFGLWMLISRGDFGHALWFAGFAAVLGGLGALSARYPAADRWVSTGFSVWIGGGTALMAALAPITLVFWLGRTILSVPGHWLQWPLLVLFGGLLALLIWPTVSPAPRDWLFRRCEALGPFRPLAPLAYAIDLVLIAAMFFATAAAIFAQSGAIAPVAPADHPLPPGQPEILHGRLLDYFLWNFMEAIPSIQFNQTVGWRRPLDNTADLLTWLLLAFKVTVAAPVISFVRHWWKRDVSGGTAATTMR